MKKKPHKAKITLNTAVWGQARKVQFQGKGGGGGGVEISGKES